MTEPQESSLLNLKLECLSMMSHELRTPMEAMRHALAILIDGVAGPLTVEQQSFAGIVQRNLHRLNALLNDFLDLSRLEAKKGELRLESGSLVAVIDAVRESLEPWARRKAITLITRVPDGLPHVLLDPLLIRQVLTNLVGNAITFTPDRGRVTIEAKLAEGRHELEVSVIDTGSRMTSDDLSERCSTFKPSGEHPTTEIVASRLGLVITQEIVELHRGRLLAACDAATGATVTFTLPLSTERS